MFTIFLFVFQKFTNILIQKITLLGSIVGTEGVILEEKGDGDEDEDEDDSVARTSQEGEGDGEEPSISKKDRKNTMKRNNDISQKQVLVCF